jgi:hypothetical protein
MTTAKGAGSLRQRRPGTWEIRVAAGTDPVTGRVIQRSVTFHSTAAEAEAYRPYARECRINGVSRLA